MFRGRKSSRLLVMALFAVLFWGRAADLKLSIAGIDAERRPTLVLTGLGTGNYGLQASTNLIRWFDLVTPDASGGELRFLHGEATNFSAWFYRGVLKTPQPPLAKIVPQVDSNSVAVGVITYAEGGRLSLTNSGGTRYTFTVAPSNVVQSVAITMQLVTNLVAFPYENEMRTALVFQPDGFQFNGAGLLEIRYPTNVPHLKVSSFTFDGAGEKLHLLPDRVTTNTTRIPVTHFSVIGTALWTPTERTKAVNARLDAVQAGYEHRLGEILATERQKQLLGGAEDNSSLVEVANAAGEFYERHLKPELTAAETDCSLFRSLAPRVLGLERQQALLGVEVDSGFLSAASTQKAMCNCLNDAIFACEDASISAESFMQVLLGVARQSALLGGNILEDCGSGSISEWINDAVNKKLPCLTQWVGTIRYSESGTFSEPRPTVTNGDGTVISGSDSLSVSYSFEGHVEQVQLEDDSIPGLFSALTWDLIFFPDASGSYSQKGSEEKNFVCRGPGSVQRESMANSTTGAESGSNEVKVHFVFEEGQLTAFTLLERKALKINTTQKLNATRTDCPTRNPVTGEVVTHAPIPTLNVTTPASHTFDTKYVPTEEIVFSVVSPTELVGTAQGTRDELLGTRLVSIPYTWTFSIKRRE